MSKTLILVILFTASMQAFSQSSPNPKVQSKQQSISVSKDAIKQAIESCIEESLIEGADEDLDESEALDYCTNLSINNEI